MILGNFCVFEGIDGTGTTTQIRELRRRCDERGVPAWFTCEPTDGDIGRLIRKALSGDIRLTPDTMTRLFAADRGEHLWGVNGIGEHLDSGEIAVTDRYFFSSIAYQGAAGDQELPFQANAGFPLPELLFFFDLDSEAAMNRVERRGGKLEIYEKREFQKRVRDKYHEILPRFAEKEPRMRLVTVDAALPVNEISEIIWNEFQNLSIFLR